MFVLSISKPMLSILQCKHIVHMRLPVISFWLSRSSSVKGYLSLSFSCWVLNTDSTTILLLWCDLFSIYLVVIVIPISIIFVNPVDVVPIIVVVLNITVVAYVIFLLLCSGDFPDWKASYYFYVRLMVILLLWMDDLLWYKR